MPSEYADDLRCDWQQFHWELLVEWPLQLKVKGLTLEVYDGGAETDTSRICNPSSVATHRICCRPRKSNHLSEMVGQSLVEFPGLSPVNSNTIPISGLSAERFMKFHRSLRSRSVILVLDPTPLYCLTTGGAIRLVAFYVSSVRTPYRIGGRSARILSRNLPRDSGLSLQKRGSQDSKRPAL